MEDTPTVFEFLEAMASTPDSFIVEIMLKMKNADVNDIDTWGDIAGDIEKQTQVLDTLRGFLGKPPI